MISRNKILYFLTALACMSLLGSCISREEYLPVQGEVSGDIEFVARPVSYSGQTVQTKATSVDDFENRIHNCYFMLFNSSGTRVIGPIDMNTMLTAQRVSRHEILSKLGSQTTCTACFVANVPKDVVDGLTTLDAVNTTILDIDYSNVDVQDTGNGNNLSSFVIPEFDLDGSGSNEPVQCLPMFGMEECNIASGDVFQIPLKRLFAKVSVNIAVTAMGSGFDILAAHMFNLPTNVRLAESEEECSWVKDATSFYAHQIEGPINDDNINGGYIGIGASTYEFYFYVPEYYLLPLPENTANFGNPKYKPQMFEAGKRPVFVRLFGTYNENNENSNITYDLYLGEDAATSFTLKRNVHYMNSMVINGITNSKDGEGSTLDCRVEVTTEQFDEVEILGQTANCYIIGQPGTYKYPACKGVFKGGVNNIPEDMKCSKGTTLKQLYIDNSSVRLDNLTYDDEAKEFSFDLVSLDGGGGLLASNDANVILGLVYNEGGQEKVEWAWHIWIQAGTTLDVNLGFFDFGASNQTYPNGYVLMDRNLGARPTTLEYPGVETGAYYRYGRKEPFLGGNYQGLVESAYYDWSGPEKAITDPCPPGYRVPASSVWSGDATNENATLTIAGIGTPGFRYWNNNTATNQLDDIYFPYSGYIDSSKKLISSFTSSYTYNGFHEEEESILGIARIRNVKYTFPMTYSSGVLLGTDMMFVYEAVDEGLIGDIDVTSLELFVGIGSWGSWTTVSATNSTVKRILSVLIDLLAANVKDEIQDKMVLVGPDNINSSYGYQVRCVRE